MEQPQVTLAMVDTVSGQRSEPLTLDCATLTADTTITPPPGSVIEVSGVTIGRGFHWEQQQAQQFEGEMRILARDSTLVVINDIDIEKYLTSVISSEMNAHAPYEFLKAHAIISRSWIMAQLARRHTAVTRTETPGEITAWYDRDDHSLYDVCADDHCQRYQGITKRNDAVVRAVDETRGIVVTCGDTVADTRFSKCCGGITELYENCWEPTPKRYLAALKDGETATGQNRLPDMSSENDARSYITSHDSTHYCGRAPRQALQAVLNDYDLTTTGYYRWSETMTAHEMGDRIHSRSGRDLGYITGIEALHRGPSGRITRLRVTGSKETLIIGKELEIRRLLSRSHLYSSAFVADIDGQGPDALITLHGAGWGHGVGLCQIGAATMALEGHSCESILSHYFPHTQLTHNYGNKE